MSQKEARTGHILTHRFSSESLNKIVSLAGLLTCPTSDSLPAGFRYRSGVIAGDKWGSQQRGLFRIYTGFPFNATL
jgi:hypothetical protein